MKSDTKTVQDHPRAFHPPPTPAAFPPLTFMSQTSLVPNSKMADAMRQSPSMEICGKSLNDTLTKLDAILSAFWARIAERALNTAKATWTIPAPTPQALPGPKGRRKMIATRGLPKRHRKRDRRHKQKLRAYPITSTHLHCKPQQPHSRPVAPCPPGQCRSSDREQLHHQNSDTSRGSRGLHLATGRDQMSTGWRSEPVRHVSL
ncbi:Hypothetical predicted protein [Pelobates cultripes]|uniref:Uncharacterized protein n=1 Tax=Pelobates cultripes TaxID=61616 RepID=A0AAD1W4N0_PELCU|nr:Hypothetical predicted protein [Pelobates cultripes]